MNIHQTIALALLAICVGSNLQGCVDLASRDQFFETAFAPEPEWVYAYDQEIPVPLQEPIRAAQPDVVPQPVPEQRPIIVISPDAARQLEQGRHGELVASDMPRAISPAVYARDVRSKLTGLWQRMNAIEQAAHAKGTPAELELGTEVRALRATTRSIDDRLDRITSYLNGNWGFLKTEVDLLMIEAQRIVDRAAEAVANVEPPEQ